jgi:hypothetical protein
MTDFFMTRMGQRFFESTMPELVKQLADLNENLKRRLPEGWNDPRQEPHDSDGRESPLVAEDKRAVDAEWGGEIRRKLGVARGHLDGLAQDLEEAGGWEETVKEIRQTLRETADMSDAPKPRPEGREHLPTAEHDRIASRAKHDAYVVPERERYLFLRTFTARQAEVERLKDANASFDESALAWQRMHADAEENLTIEKDAHHFTRQLHAVALQRGVDLEAKINLITMSDLKKLELVNTKLGISINDTYAHFREQLNNALDDD